MSLPSSFARVPMSTFRPALDLAVRQAGIPKDKVTSGLSKLCNMSVDTIHNYLGKDEIPFDVADLLLCKLGAAYLWWTELGDFYWNLDLDERICLFPSCGNPIVVFGQSNYQDKKYCSDNHRRLHGYYRQKETHAVQAA